MTNLVRVPIIEASDDQLRAFCEIQQVDIASAKTRADVLAALGPAWDFDYILATSVPTSDGVRQEDAVSLIPQEQLTINTGRDDPVVKLKVGTTTYPGGDKPVPLSHNASEVAVLQRNKLVAMPYRFYLMLRDAISAETRPALDANGNERGTDDVEYTNYPLVHVEMPPQSAIQAWHKRYDTAEFCPA